MQFQVPQFIDTEDKVVGPLTLKQFFYVGGAAFVSAVLYFVLQTWLWIIVSAVLVGIAVAVAFVKIQGRSFLNIIISAFNFYWRPQTYVWQPEHTTVKLTRPKEKDDESALQKILATSTQPKQKWTKPIVKQPEKPVEKPKPQPKPEPAPVLSRQSIGAAENLHKSLQALQLGLPTVKKNSDKQYFQRKFEERYQIFQKVTGDRNAAKRVDYR